MKRIFDILAAGTAFLILSPLFLIIAVAIKFDSLGPIFFRQKRLGKDLSVFEMLKFRSMVENAEKLGTGLFSYGDDPRVTRTGRILRRTSLDELPQLLNILGGSMSFVGPRPPVTYELGDVADFTDYMKIRFQVKPGLTGLSQVSGRNDLSWDDKFVWDNLYVERYHKWGILYDVVIILRTFYVVLAMKNSIETKPEEKANELD